MLIWTGGELGAQRYSSTVVLVVPVLVDLLPDGSLVLVVAIATQQSSIQHIRGNNILYQSYNVHNNHWR